MQALESRQRWMSVLAHSRPEQLRSHWQALNLSPGYRSIRAPEIGLAQLQGRMGATGRRSGRCLCDVADTHRRRSRIDHAHS